MQVLEDLHAADNILADPGDEGNILATQWLSVVPIATAEAEDRAVKDPGKAGMMLHLMFVTDEGDATITFDTAFNTTGPHTIVTFSDAGESATFISTDDGSGNDTYNWAHLDTGNGAALS